MSSDEDELPPLLVDVEATAASEEEPQPIKVPITIVTGQLLFALLLSSMFLNDVLQDT